MARESGLKDPRGPGTRNTHVTSFMDSQHRPLVLLIGFLDTKVQGNAVLQKEP